MEDRLDWLFSEPTIKIKNDMIKKHIEAQCLKAFEYNSK